MANKNAKQTSRKAAKKVSGLSKSPASAKKVKSVTGSALTQTKSRKKK